MRFALIAALFAVGCSKKAADVPSCAMVVDNMLTITKAAMPGHGDMEMGNKKQMVEQCEVRKLTDDQKRCMVAAKDLNSLATCTPRPTAPQ